MNRARWKEIDDHFARALELPDAQQLRFVRETLVRDPELGSAVKDLLESAAEAEAVLGESAAVFAGPLLAALTDDEWDALHPGAIVGGYRLLREIGRGERSTIYLAEAAKARFGKRVAIKVVTRGIDTAEILARIHHHHGMLVALEHPGIARFYSGGSTAGGLPYLIVELVDGQPLVAWCDQRQLDVPSRLRLFLQVCAAVQHAHQHLVAHRDLEPSRILVSDQGSVKVLAFGFGGLLRAENEAGPHQRFEPVTTATDVRALGAVLHQLLSGRRPYLPDAHERPIAERRSTAMKPNRMSDAAVAAGEAVGRAHGTSPRQLGSQLRGDLDAIVTRALEQEPALRYQSARELADDITRHLAHRPVTARPASLPYRAARFVRRHRTRLGVMALLVFAMMAVVGTTAFRSADVPAPTMINSDGPPSGGPATPVPEAVRLPAPIPVTAPVTTAAAPTAAASAPAAPRQEVARPGIERGKIERPIAENLAASERLRRSPADSAAMLSRMATALRKAGKNAEAEGALREALQIRIALDGRESLSVAERQWELGDLFRTTHRYAEADGLLRSSLRIRKQLADSQSAEVGQSLAGLALLECEQGRTVEYDSLFTRALEIYRRLPAESGGLRMPETDRAQCR